MKTRTQFRYDVIPYSVYDGDTFKGQIQIDLGFKKHFQEEMNFRIMGIDTPEVKKQNKLPIKIRAKHKLAGLIVKKFVSNLILNNKMIIDTYKKPDKYGRVLCDLTIPSENNSYSNIKDILTLMKYAKEYNGGTKHIWTEKELDLIISRSK